MELSRIQSSVASGGTRTMLVTTPECQGAETMTDLKIAVATQMASIVQRTRKTIPELAAIATGSGPSKHGEWVRMDRGGKCCGW